MTTVRIFLSFEFDRDSKLRQDFYTQASSRDSGYAIENYSMNEPYRPHSDRAWLKKARALISQSDIVIVLVGQDTHNAPGVEKEVTITHQENRPIFQIRPQGSTAGRVAGAGDLIPWKWKRIDAKISEYLDE